MPWIDGLAQRRSTAVETRILQCGVTLNYHSCLGIAGYHVFSAQIDLLGMKPGLEQAPEHNSMSGFEMKKVHEESTSWGSGGVWQ